MNERIRELAEQAGYVPLEPRTFADDLQDIFLKKFAELIVRDCSLFVFKQNGPKSALNLLEHFGIEE